MRRAVNRQADRERDILSGLTGRSTRRRIRLTTVSSSSISFSGQPTIRRSCAYSARQAIGFSAR
jgi:hypothetical protein